MQFSENPIPVASKCIPWNKGKLTGANSPPSAPRRKAPPRLSRHLSYTRLFEAFAAGWPQPINPGGKISAPDVTDVSRSILTPPSSYSPAFPCHQRWEPSDC
jgi:hypothetical protein